MNRRHTAGDYRRTVERLRRARPDLALSSDFIVGFPGETERDFAATLRLVTEVGYAQAYSFKFSPRPGTPAAALEPQVPDPIKAERLATLQALLGAQQAAFNQGSVGRTLPVLLELKIASGMSAPHRMQDLADAMRLIAANELARSYTDRLDPSVRARFLELWDLAQIKEDY